MGRGEGWESRHRLQVGYERQGRYLVVQPKFLHLLDDGVFGEFECEVVELQLLRGLKLKSLQLGIVQLDPEVGQDQRAGGQGRLPVQLMQFGLNGALV